MTKSPFLSLVIPAFHAERVIRGTIDSVQEHAARRKWEIEIVVGFSRGRDATREVLELARRDYENVSVVDTPQHGKGAAIRAAMAAASGRIRCFIDADNAAPFEQIDRALPLLDKYDMVIGSRYVAGGSAGDRSLPRVLLSRGGNLLFQLVLGLRFADTRAPLKVYRSETADRLFPALRLNGFGFDTELLFLAQRLGYRIVEFPVRWESGDESTVRVPRDAIRSLVELFQIRWHWWRGSYREALHEASSEAARRTALVASVGQGGRERH